MAKQSYVKVKTTFLLPIDKSNLSSVSKAGELIDNVKSALRAKGAVITELNSALVTPAKDPVDMDSASAADEGVQQDAAD